MGCYTVLPQRGSGGIGRRASLRSWWPKGRRGSSPFFRTKNDNPLLEAPKKSLGYFPATLLPGVELTPLPHSPILSFRRTPLAVLSRFHFSGPRSGKE